MLPNLPGYSSRDLAHVLWSLQRLRILPDIEWTMEMHLAVRARLPQFDAPSLVMMLAAYGGYTYVARNMAAMSTRRPIQVSLPGAGSDSYKCVQVDGEDSPS